MDKRIRIRLNNYTEVPAALGIAVADEIAGTEVSVDLAKLFHHYYLDTYGRAPPDPDPAHFEHIRSLAPEPGFRFLGRGPGISTSARRSRSTEMGQAFFRWFLHEYLGITYFAHVSELLDRQDARAEGGWTLRRTAPGNAPDYLCAESVNSVFLGEAKGRYSSISFKRKDFSDWRAQFRRVQVLDASGSARVVKGHIVATRFATEKDSPSIETTLFAEDPRTAGQGPLEGESARELAAAVIGIHYSRLAEKLNQPLLAASLMNGVRLPEEILVQAVLWRLVIDPLKERRFIGGYYPGPNGDSAFEVREGSLQVKKGDPLRLDMPRGTFFGIEEEIFRQVVSTNRRFGAVGPELRKLENTERIYSAISMLKDGSALGPVEFFQPVEFVTL